MEMLTQFRSLRNLPPGHESELHLTEQIKVTPRQLGISRRELEAEKMFVVDVM